MVRITLDTNVLVYAVHTIDPRNARAVEIVTRAARGDCVLTMQSLGECFNVLVRKRGMPAGLARDEIAKFRRSFEYFIARPEDLDNAMDAVDRHKLSFWDSLLWATAQRVGCRVIFSEDMQSGRELWGVKLLNPFDSKNDLEVDNVFAASEDPLP